MDSQLKRTMLVVAAGAGGVTIALVVLATVGIRYISRPKPPKPWNTHVLLIDPENFGAEKDGKHVWFSYEVQNTGDADYRIESETQPRVLLRFSDGTLSNAVAPETASVEGLPVFIPPKQKALVVMTLAMSAIPQQRQSESDEQYDERLRAWWQHDTKESFKGFVLFDETNRYEIELPMSVKPSTADLPPCPANDPLGIRDRSKPCKPLTSKKGAPPCPANNPAGLYATSPCAPLPQ